MDYQGGDGGGGFGGGGYDGGGGGGFDQGSSQQSAQKPRKNYDEQTLIPITIHMALEGHADESGDGSIILQDGRKLSNVVIVGSVRQFSNNSTNVSYDVEDSTGLLTVKQWVDDNDCSAILELREKTLVDNIYIKAIGQIKDYQGNRCLMANSVRPLSTGNELTHHFLSVIHSGNKYKTADSIVPPMNMMSKDGVGFGQTIGDVGLNNGGTGNPTQDRALAIIREIGNQEESGCHISQIAAAMGGIPEAEVRQLVTELSDNGEIYSTTSDEHFQVAA
ncbi:MAG: hypothetical protein SGBAC_002352 [Bacillariaceae sp.]